MKIRAVLVACLALSATACTSGDAEVADTAQEPAPVLAAATDAELPTILVYKTETCGCCNGWVEHLRAAGFEVDARDVVDIVSVKRDTGVPGSMTSCHTALVDGYAIEGHVPADQIKKMLAERPEIAGLAVPGMPVGSPGMEGPGATPYQVLSWDQQGNAAVYAEIDPR